MLVGIISDTHNQLDRTRQAMDRLLAVGVQAVIHCGDFTRPEMLSLCAAVPLTFVLGNNDPIAELEAAGHEAGAISLGWGGEVTLAGRRIAVTHGHRLGEVRRLLATEPDYLLSGHSHHAGEERVGTIRCVNPGALHRAATYSVAVIDLAKDAVRFLDVPR
jgi:putative phosphoesterase